MADTNQLVDLNTLNIAYGINKKRIDFFSDVINPCYKEGEGDDAKEGVEISKPITVRDKDATSTFEGGLTVEGNTSIDGTLSAVGKATFTDDVTVGKALGVEGDATIKGELDVKKIVSASGALEITGNVTADEDLTVEGNASIDGTLKVADNFEVGANSASFNKEVEFNGTLKATENATFDKEVTLKSDLKLSSWSITQDADGSLIIKYNA